MMGKKRRNNDDDGDGRFVLSRTDQGLLGELGEEEASTSLLADDTLTLVFNKIPTRFLLSSVALVCRRWKRLCISHSVIELVPSPFSTYDRPWGSLVLKDLLHLANCYSSTIQNIVLAGIRNIKTADIIYLLKKLPKLRSISFVPTLTVELEEIAHHLPGQLIRLHFECICHQRAPCNEYLHRTLPSYESSLKVLCDKCPNLEALSFEGYFHVRPREIDDFLSGHGSLTSLELNSYVIGWPEVENIFKRCKFLRHLSLESPLFVKSENIDDNDNDEFDMPPTRSRRGIYERSQSVSTRIEGCDLESCFPIHLSSMRFYFSAHRAVPLDLNPLFGLIKGRGHQLQHLHGHSLFNTSWHTISIWCANLQTLDLSHTSSELLDMTGIEEVVLCGIPRLLKKLQRVALPTATDRILVEFGHYCPHLRELRFQGYFNGNVGSHRMTSLTDRGVVALAEGCNALKVLDLAGSRNITLSSIRALAFHCRNLKVLILNGCRLLGHDEFLVLWSRLAQSLLFVDLIGSKMNSDTMLRALELLHEHGSTLRVLVIPKSHKKLLRSKILELEKRLPSLAIRIGFSGIHWHGFYHANNLVEL